MTLYRVSRLAVHRLACAGLTFWSLGFIVGIFMMVMRTEDKHHRDALRRYGYFYIGLEPSFWWWDIVVKRLDMMLTLGITYTNFVPDERAKMLFYTFVAGGMSPLLQELSSP